MNLQNLLNDKAEVLAPRLLGCELVRTINGKVIRVRIVETEAYDQSDLASHSYNGRTPRSEVMFGPAGRLYVYFTYGMHYCCNIVVGEVDHGAAVLLRAVEPLEGIDEMSKLRGNKEGADISNGPAKLCQALSIDKRLNGHDLTNDPLKLIIKNALTEDEIITSVRIGISKALDVPWRFYIKDDEYVSKYR